VTLSLAGTLLVLGAFTTAAPGRRALGMGHWVLSPGTVGPLRIGVSTEQDVLRAAGPPTLNVEIVGVRWEVRARYLGYGSCRGACRTAFWIDARTHRLTDFRTTSTTFRTDRGTRIGTPIGVAERSQESGARGALGCASTAIVQRSARGRIWLGISESRVRMIYVGGPSSLVYPCTFGLERDISLVGSGLIG
jgi:hypothetical protein